MSNGKPTQKASPPAADEPSDVRRLSGLFVGAAVAAVASLVGIFATEGAAALRSPGALSRPHARAGLGCSDCHGQAEPTGACTQCHGAHPTTRAGHKRMRNAGKMNCVTCHDSHRSDQGVALLSGGVAERYGNGWSVRSEVATGFSADKPVHVATIDAKVCSECHALADPRDAIFVCLSPGGATSGATLCFDEHQTAASAGAESVPRDGAWEAARLVLKQTPPAPPTARGSWLLFGLFCGALVWTSRQAQLRFRTRRRSAVAPEGMRPAQVVRLPQINATTCLGCNACVDACPYNVIEMRSFIAQVARPDDCCGLTLCEQKCPNGSIVVRDGEPILDRPRVDDALQSVEVPGLFLAGDLTGMPLIKNAINQGAHAVRGAARQLAKGKRKRAATDCDVLIVGAGPAGLSAALEAKNLGLSALVLEQGSVASSIQSFPRGKLVFDQPLDVPLIGELWLEEATKEELLSKWLRIVRKEALEIREHRRVVAVTPEAAGTFVVRATDPEGVESALRCGRVVLAIGRRGTPRRLAAPIADDALNQVFYGISDAKSFSGARVLVVGLGDSALETAVALSHQPGTHVTVAYRGTEFRRGKPRNVAALRAAQKQGRVDLSFETEVTRIDPGRVTLRRAGIESELHVDAVVVLIGTLLPWPFLESIGVHRPLAPDAVGAAPGPQEPQEPRAGPAR